MLLLDTNALLWVLQDNPRISPAVRSMVVEAWAVGSVAVSVVTFWEIAVLVDKQKLVLGCDPAHWRMDRINDGLREFPLYGSEAVRAVALGHEGLHEDPADRFIVATALVGGGAYPVDNRQADTRLGWRITMR